MDSLSRSRGVLALLLFSLLTTPAWAYLDPGVTAVLAQLLSVAFYGLLTVFAFLGKPFAFLRRRKKQHEESTEQAAVEEASTEAPPPLEPEMKTPVAAVRE